MVDLEHPLVKLGEKIDWAVFEAPLGRTFDGKTGAPGINTGLMVARWVENPYWQQLSVAVTIKGGWLLEAMCVPGNPYDGHTLYQQIQQMNRLYRKTDRTNGPRGHGLPRARLCG